MSTSAPPSRLMKHLLYILLVATYAACASQSSSAIISIRVGPSNHTGSDSSSQRRAGYRLRSDSCILWPIDVPAVASDQTVEVRVNTRPGSPCSASTVRHVSAIPGVNRQSKRSLDTAMICVSWTMTNGAVAAGRVSMHAKHCVTRHTQHDFLRARKSCPSQ